MVKQAQTLYQDKGPLSIPDKGSRGLVIDDATKTRVINFFTSDQVS